MRHIAAFVAVVLLVCNFAQAQLPEGMKVNSSNGTITWGDVTLRTLHFAPGWQATTQSGAFQADQDYPKTSQTAHEMRGKWSTGSGHTMTYWQRLRQLGADGVELSASVSADKHVPTLSLSMTIEVPTTGYAGRTISFDGTPVTFPPELKDQLIDSRSGVSSVVLPTSAGVLRINGSFDTYLQDGRQYGGAAYSLRLHFKPGEGELTSAVFTATLQRSSFNARPIDISKQANTDFRDDGEGGWTNQGSANDLRMLHPGLRPIGNVPFRVLDSDENDGKSCLVFGGTQKPDLPSQTIPTGDQSAKYMYLLHASAWTPREGNVGTIVLEHADGTQTSVEVQAPRDVGDWWAPTSRPNAAVAWTAENASAYVGLYVSRFELPSKPLRALTLKSAGSAVWMVVAMSLSDDNIPTPVEGPTYIVEGADWRPIEAFLDVDKGSALDFSFLNDAPAGKHGRLVIRNGRFQFQNKPGEPVRFYGANLCFSANFPDHQTAERLADRLAAIGYNSIRLHHYDHDLTHKAAADSTTLDPEQLDRINYLIHCLKRRGMYINIDLYTFRETKPGEIPELSGAIRGEYKAAVYLFDSAFNNWTTFVKNVMTQKNKYTGLTWAEDPTFIGVCPLNEDPLGVQVSASTRIRAEFDKRFDQWLKDKQQTAPADKPQRDRLYVNFLMDVQREGIRKQFAFLKSIGVKAPLSSVNVVNAVSLTPVRAELEYVDNHSYWDHPGFPEKDWDLPHSYQNRSATSSNAWVPAALATPRIVGKPYTITEINYCNPNRFRAEGGPLMSAYAGLQDWDAIWRFAYSHSREHFESITAAGGFDVATDPMQLLTERLAALMFLRRDVAPGKGEIICAVNDTNAYKEVSGWGGDSFPPVVNHLALHTRIASRYEAGATGPLALVSDDKRHAMDDNVLSSLGIGKDAIDPDAGRFISDTGQIDLDAKKGTLKLATDRGECFVLTEGAESRGNTVSARSTAGPFNVVYVGSLDGKPLRESGRLIVMHLTDLQNTKTKYRNASKTLLEQWGDLPHLVRTGSADLSLKLNTGNLKAYALDLAGKRVREVELKRDGDAVQMQISISGDQTPSLVYEIIRE